MKLRLMAVTSAVLLAMFIVGPEYRKPPRWPWPRRTPRPTRTPWPTRTPEPTPYAGGVLRMLVVRAKIGMAEPVCSELELGESTFAYEESIRAAYAESSREAVQIEGGVVTVDAPPMADCRNRTAWADEVDALIDVEGYDRTLYVLPFGTCLWSGNFDMGGVRLYTTRCGAPKVAAHELGHTLGMYHASTDDHEYGDFSCLMGGGRDAPLSQLNAPHLWQKGWVGVQEAVSGIFEIQPSETAEYVLRVGDYYISLRKAIGIDTNLQDLGYLDTISVHWFDETIPPRRTVLKALLLKGEEYTGPDFTVRVLSIGDTATVEIRKGE